MNNYDKHSKYLPFTRATDFNELNRYIRVGTGMLKWEVDFLQEGTGHTYSEDKQSFKRIQKSDKSRGTNHAAFYREFHIGWYTNKGISEWAREVQRGRDKDIVNNVQRVLTTGHVGTTREPYEVDLAHNPNHGINDMEKSSEPLPKKNKQPKHYQPSDYQFNINPFAPRWAESIIDCIDMQRGVREENEIEVGVIKLNPGQDRWGWYAHRKPLYITTMVIPNHKVIRECFSNPYDAKQFLKELKHEYKNFAHTKFEEE